MVRAWRHAADPDKTDTHNVLILNACTGYSPLILIAFIAPGVESARNRVDQDEHALVRVCFFRVSKWECGAGSFPITKPCDGGVESARGQAGPGVDSALTCGGLLSLAHHPGEFPRSPGDDCRMGIGYDSQTDGLQVNYTGMKFIINPIRGLSTTQTMDLFHGVKSNQLIMDVPESAVGEVARRERLSGILKHYYREVA